MSKKAMFLISATIWILTQTGYVSGEYARVTPYDTMKCSYGERGSLTATCVNATPQFFKSTLYKFDHLDETLRCVNCTLTVIESNTFDLSGNRVTILDLTHSAIETLKSKAFMGLIFLESLYLSNNKIRSIYPGTFTGTKKVELLDISQNELAILSESGFAELVALEELRLGHNQIKVIDNRAFNNLTRLKLLDLSYNLISTLNTSLDNLTSLERLSLSHNAIHQLDGLEFHNLNALTELELAYNSLTEELVLSMAPDNKLMLLDLSSNKMNSLWFRYSNLKQLEGLFLAHNNISVIDKPPSEIMFNLRMLILDFNQLTHIKIGDFTGFPQLRLLNVSHNNLSEVRITGIQSLHNLDTLDLSYNRLSNLDYSALLARLPALAYLKLEDNVLPCDLEKEMEDMFAEDNFKFVLYDNTVGSPKCVDTPVIKTFSKRLNDVYAENTSNPSSALDVVVLVLLSLVLVAIGVLFYMQYLIYNGKSLGCTRRVASTVHLIPAEEQLKEDGLDQVEVL